MSPAPPVRPSSSTAYRRRNSRLLTLAFPLLLFAIAVTTITLPFRDAILTRRFETGVKSTLLEIQRALQDYHVAEENYPPRTPRTGAEIVGFLIDAGHLKTPPLNPWTMTPYRLDDSGQPDGIVYRTDELAETYALEAKSRRLASGEVVWMLDSTEHQSLE